MQFSDRVGIVAAFLVLFLGSHAPAQQLSAAFIYVGPVGDAGWTYRHDAGRKCLENQGIRTAYVESVPETPTSPMSKGTSSRRATK